MIPLILLTLVLLYTSWSVICLELNYRRAKSMGIPLIRMPVDPLNIPLQVVEPHIFRIVDFFRIPLPKACMMMRRGWHFGVKAQFHEEMGPIWAFVTPRDIHVQVCDTAALHNVFGRRGDFVRPREFYQLLAAFGPCLSTATPSEWARHRKILATPFMNESIMDYVWNESLRQTQQMVQAWTTKGAVIRIGKDTRTLSLNVLAAIGFRRSFKFESSAKEPTTGGSPNETFDYRDALQMVLDNAILVMVVGWKNLLYPWLPAWIRRIGKAASDFQKHMEIMLNEEMEALNRGEKGMGTIMTAFVRGLDAHQKDPSKGNSVEEIYGNTFVINFAGHDTTANTLAFATLLLAGNQDVQEWVAEEVQQFIGEDEDDWKYAEAFPKLVRSQAVLLETLRLFPPVMAIPKWTNEQPQKLIVAGKPVTLPPGTGVFMSIMAAQTYKSYWTDPLVWKPSRWITHNSTGSLEKITTDPQVPFYSWSGGPQNCPGEKFSKVEFVAVLAGLLHKHRIRPVKEVGESVEETRKRFTKVANDCDALMLLRCRDTDQVEVTCERVAA
ncbi:putative cytochrome P450 monooxygenase [Clohesyomyces aquaticus]|uniref:Putative cytochrome P450 monooxygenase n=1 Tax=Clohesyomyces aquaticus TaxID=1231657 RepID=A0A1Y1Z7J2_9PLEO|nr:putative cytochrome P450 monooxygenase [Clohesyomyces aquaticus]